MKGRKRKERPNNGAGHGNWGGRFVGQRVSYSTEFDEMFGLLCDAVPSPLYEPTVRGVCEALGLDRDTFQRYRTGEYKMPLVVKMDMWALINDEVPPPFYWDYVSRFRINPVFRVMEDSEERENVLEVEFERYMFHVRPFWMAVNRKFREVIWQFTNEHTPVLDRHAWAPILEAALSGGHSGKCAEKKAEEYEQRVAEWKEDRLTPYWKRKMNPPRPTLLSPPSPWQKLPSGNFVHKHTLQIHSRRQPEEEPFDD
jgi:hypothetical protein